MIPGTGPGRGVPWWRFVSALWTRRFSNGDPEPVGRVREGRLIRRVPG